MAILFFPLPIFLWLGYGILALIYNNIWIGVVFVCGVFFIFFKHELNYRKDLKTLEKFKKITQKELQNKKQLHYQTSSNKIIFDREMGLEWYMGPNLDTNYYEAKKWIKKINGSWKEDCFDGGGWRLPTLLELQSIYQEDDCMNMGKINWWVWSSDTCKRKFALGFNLEYGRGEISFCSHHENDRVVAVRFKK